jgi:hypothetical protein
MGRLRWIALVGMALVTAAVIAVPAIGRDRRHPVAVIACKRVAPGVCEESGTVDLPANSYGSQSTDTVPPDARTADVSLVPDAPPDKVPFDNLWLAIVDEQPKLAGVKSGLVQRFITCNMLAIALTFSQLENENVDVPLQTFNNAYSATLYVCLAIAFSQPPPSGATAAGSRPCQANVGVPIEISRSRSRYRISALGKTSTPRHRPPIAVSCRRRGGGLVISLRSRRGTLRGLLGPHLTIGYANRGSSSVHFRTKYRFSR